MKRTLLDSTSTGDRVLLVRRRGANWVFTREFADRQGDHTGFVYRTRANLYAIMIDEDGFWIGRFFSDPESQREGFMNVTRQIGGLSLEWPWGVWAW